MTLNFLRVRQFPDSIFKQPSFAARILCGAGYAVFPFLPPRKNEGMEHRVAHQSFVLPRSLLENAGASRRSIAAISVPRVRVSWDEAC